MLGVFTTAVLLLPLCLEAFGGFHSVRRIPLTTLLYAEKEGGSAMGRVTVFTINDCPHCKRAKGALSDNSIPYTEISLNSYPGKRKDMLSLSDRLTVPQIFFNEKHIGGADDLMDLLSQWDKESKFPTKFDRFQSEVESQAAPTDPRLAVPDTPPVTDSNPVPPRNEKEDSVALPTATGHVSVLEITKTLIKIMPRADLSYHAKVYKNSFTGSDGVKAIMEHYGLPDKKEAVEFGRLLQKRQILHHVTKDYHAFDDTDSYYFRLQPFHQPHILNSFRIWTDRIDPNPVSLVQRLLKQIRKIKSDATDNEGAVDYIAALQDPNYSIFEEAVCELQGVSMKCMNENTKLAFGINLYNLMIEYAFIKVGIPSTPDQRTDFFGKVCVNVGGDVLSFNDLEHGVIRANSPHPGSTQNPFSSEDSRIELPLKTLDRRIHFALNCGAKSCPPVKVFSADSIEEELRIVALSFCEQAENVYVDEMAGKITLSMLFKWYCPDFAPSIEELPGTIVQFLRGEKKEQMQRMAEKDPSDVTIDFFTYDWGTSASQKKEFSGKVILAEETVE